MRVQPGGSLLSDVLLDFAGRSARGDGRKCHISRTGIAQMT
jgi:hypothetical protein